MNEVPEFSPDERELLRDSSLMQDLVQLESWRRLEEITKAQIEVRKTMLLLPSHQRPDQQGMDKEAREGSDDYVKGVIYGLSLSLGTPHDIIENAKAVTGSNADDEEIE